MQQLPRAPPLHHMHHTLCLSPLSFRRLPVAVSYPSPSRYTWVSLQRGRTRPRVQLEELAGQRESRCPPAAPHFLAPSLPLPAPTCYRGSPLPGGLSHPGSRGLLWKLPAGSGAEGVVLPPAGLPGGGGKRESQVTGPADPARLTRTHTWAWNRPLSAPSTPPASSQTSGQWLHSRGSQLLNFMV